MWICRRKLSVSVQEKTTTTKNTVITDRVLYSLHHASCCQSIAVWFNDKLIIGQVSVNNQVYPLQLWNTELQRWQCFWSVCVNMAWQPTPRHNDQHLGVCVCVCMWGRKTQRENSYPGSKALRLSSLISLIRTQTITVPFLSSSLIPPLPNFLVPGTAACCCRSILSIASPISLHLLSSLLPNQQETCCWHKNTTQ